MRLGTIVVSVGLHVGLAVGLVAVAQKRELRHKAISVAVTEEKKKAPPKPPAPPKPIVARPAAPRPAATVAKAEVAPAPRAAAPAPMATNLSMSNEDVGPGIGLQGRAPKAAAAAPARVASALSEARTRRTREEAGAGDAPCEEEPSKPEAVVKTTLDYTLYPEAQQNGIEGKFKARLTVDASGEVSNVEVLSSVDAGLDAAIVAALQKWRFKPATACGKPVAGGTFVVQRTFELGD